MSRSHMETVILSLDLGKTSGYTIIEVEGNHLTLKRHGLVRGGEVHLGPKLKNELMPELLGYGTMPYAGYEAAVRGTYKRKDGRRMAMKSDAVIACKTILEHYCREFGVPFQAFMPSTIKKAVTGNGRASKQQVRLMAQQLLGVEFKRDPEYHISDAAAVGITMANRLHLEGK